MPHKTSLFRKNKDRIQAIVRLPEVRALPIAAAVAALAILEPAHAQDGWESPATDLIETLNSGLVKIGAVLIGVAIIAFGMWGALTARIDWMRLAMILIGGGLVMAGPAMIDALLSTIGGS